MRRTLVLTSILVSAAVAGSAGLATAIAPKGSKTNRVAATTSASKGFAPKIVVARPGKRVYFRNVDRAPHNGVHNPVRGKVRFKSGPPTTGNFSFKAPVAVGRYPYICTFHPFMKGTLVVKKAA